MSHVKLTWKDGLNFEAQQDDHKYMLDPSKKEGITPKAMVLSAMAGCSGMDVVAILKKMRVPDYQLEIEVNAQVQEEHPKVYQTTELIFRFTGKELPENKLKRAVELSVDKYCPVIAMLKDSVDIKSKIFINNEEIKL